MQPSPYQFEKPADFDKHEGNTYSFGSQNPTSLANESVASGMTEKRDYMDSLKELQNAGRIGALGLGQVNIDKLQSHLNQRTMSPAGTETRCFRPTNSSEKKFEIDRSTNMP